MMMFGSAWGGLAYLAAPSYSPKYPSGALEVVQLVPPIAKPGTSLTAADGTTRKVESVYGITNRADL